MGVLVVVYGSGGSPGSSQDASEAKSPFIGNVLTLIASLCYALYQVLYDMYAVPPSENAHGTNPEWQRISVTSIDDLSDDEHDDVPQDGSVVYPPPFGLYANLLTSGIGLMTLLFFWIPIPILSLLGVEAFQWPTESKILLGLAGIAVSAFGFLASFMVR